MYIQYDSIPNQHKLFLDYINDFSSVQQFYKKDFRKSYNYIKTFDELSSFNRPFFGEVIADIKKQYNGFRYSKQTEINLNLLKSPKTLAIVTGQQLGLFGGPLYTFYKVITAIKLAIDLKSKFEGYNFVPFFWLEADDHDFEEVNYFNIIDKENNIKKIEYNDGFTGSNRGNVGGLTFNEELNNMLNELKNSIRQTEFSDIVADNIVSFYKEGTTFKEAFRKLMFNFFDEYGLVIFDPQTPAIKKCLKPIFMKELDDYREHSLIAVETSANLEEEYHAQIKIKPINLFLNEDDGRYLLEPDEDNFKLKNKRKKYTKDEIFQILNKQPERFSPNVLLRPICQDYLLPTAFYIAGPGEISYFAQVIPFYEVFNLVQPFIYPRAAATLLEKPVKDLLEKFELEIVDVFEEDKVLLKNILSKITPFDTEEIFNETNNQIKQVLDELKYKLSKIDTTLVDNVEKNNEKILQNIQLLKGKAEKSLQIKNESTVRQINKIKIVLYPNMNLQERELNLYYFANKYGIGILKYIFNQLSINKFEHQIIEL